MIKYFKYYIFAVLICGIITVAGTITYAASLENVEVTLSSGERIIYVSGRVADMEKEQDISVNAVSQSEGELYALAQEYVTSDGTFAIQCSIRPDMKSAYLDIVIGGRGIENAYKVTYYYADANESASALAAVNEAVSEQRMHETLEEYGKRGVISVDTNDEKYTSQSAYVDRVMADTAAKKKFGSLDEVNAAFAAALVMQDTISSNNILNVLSDNVNRVYFLRNEECAFTDIKDKKSAQAVLKSLITDKISDVWEFEKGYKRAYALIRLNNALKSEIPELLRTYNDVFELNLDGDYKKVPASEIAKLLYDRGYTTIDALKNDFDNGLKQIISASSSKPSGGSGGGSGGGGGSKYTSFPSTEILKNEENYDKEYEAAEEYVFSDMASAEWAAEAVRELMHRGIINGFGDGTFRPNNLITRAEFVKMVVTGFGYTESSDIVEFDDVCADDWYYSYVKAAASNGIVKGAYGLFMPDAVITREDSAVILYNILSSNLSGDVIAEVFTDDSDIADYAAEAVHKLKAAEVINGFEDGSFRPKEGLSRAQAAKILQGTFVIGGNENGE